MPLNVCFTKPRAKFLRKYFKRKLCILCDKCTFVQEINLQIFALSFHYKVLPVEDDASKLSVAGLAFVGGCKNLRQIIIVVILDLVILGKRKYC